MTTHKIPNDYTPPVDVLAERVILVTGAGDGIGKAVSLAFAAHGATGPSLRFTPWTWKARFPTITGNWRNA
jgi:hypothetical protein